MINANIVGINAPKGRAVALTDAGEYVLIEISGGDEFELHDEIIGKFDLHPLGDEIVKNLNKDEKIDIYIQDYCDRQLAEEYLKATR